MSTYGGISETRSLARDGGQHLLVAVDEPDNAELLSTTLELAGYRIGIAGSGTEVLTRLAEQRFELVVIDAELPEMDALAQGRRLVTHRPPVLLLTAWDALDKLLPELGAGERDYVTKPFRIAEVLARIQVLLRGRAGVAGTAHCTTRTWSWTTPPARPGAAGAPSTSRPPSTGCCAISSSTRTRCCPRSRSADTSGATSVATTRWSSSSPASGARSTRRARRSSTPAEASATGSDGQPTRGECPARGLRGIRGAIRGHTFPIHTSGWDHGCTGGDADGGLTGLAGKRVGLIGTGATAIQVVPHLGRDARQLYGLQRTVLRRRTRQPAHRSRVRPGARPRLAAAP